MNESNFKTNKVRLSLPLTLQCYEDCSYDLFALGMLGEIIEGEEKGIKVKDLYDANRKQRRVESLKKAFYENCKSERKSRRLAVKGKEGNITHLKSRRLCQRKVGMQQLG